MEHREAPRMATAEARTRDADPDPVHGRRFARFLTPPSTRRFAPTRLVLALLALTVATTALVVVGSHALHAVITWLHWQPQYQIEFREIDLEPDPPAWYRGGSARFLDRVRENSPGRSETLSVLDEDLKALTNDFKLYAWVTKVVRIQRSSRRIVVSLEYRAPVAFAFEGARQIVLDREGVILPREDLDLEASGRLIQVCDLEPPHDPRPGLPWKMADAAKGIDQADPRVLAASRLAEFLKSVAAKDEAEIPALEAIAVHPAPDDSHKWFVEFKDQLMLFWDDPPGAEADGEPSAEAKWAMFREWAKRNDLRTVKYPHYLRFSGGNGVALSR